MWSVRKILAWIIHNSHTFLVKVADAWYNNQLDALTVLRDASKSREVSYSDVEQTVREAIFASESQDWREKKRLVKEDLETRIEHLNMVFGMLTYMGLTEQQAETVLGILCSEENISNGMRGELVSLYKDCLTLEPFIRENKTIPIQGAEEVFKTSHKEKILRFLICVQSCLPIAVDASSLETSLSEVGHCMMGEKIKAGLMQASGVISEECTTRHSLPCTADLVTMHDTACDEDNAHAEEERTLFVKSQTKGKEQQRKKLFETPMGSL